MSKIYRLPVVWTVMGYVDVVADNIKDACDLAIKPDMDLPEDGEPLDDSFGLDREGVLDKAIDAGEGDVDLDVLPEEYWK